MRYRKIFYSLLLFSLLVFACKKETETQYVYGVNDVSVSKGGSSKATVKTTTEFASIAYSDLFGNTIGSNELAEINLAYAGFGDKKLIEDMIIRNFLKKTNAIPSNTTMRADVTKFVNETYSKFLNREPTEFERWSLVNTINTDTSITPEMVYYSVLTSNEYRYY